MKRKNKIRFPTRLVSTSGMLFKQAAGVLFFLLLSYHTAFAQQQAAHPNFLVIFTDDQTYRAIGYNNKLVKTPNLDALATRGIIFDKAFTASPICAASRASILTGIFPQKNGTVALNTQSFTRNIVVEQRYKTLAHFLSAAGYATYFSGKSHLGEPKDYGFEFGSESRDVTDSLSFRQAAEFISDTAFGKKPFLFWFAAKQPHLPLNPAHRWIDLYEGVDFPLEPNYRESPPAGSLFNQGLPGERLYLNSNYYKDNYKRLPAGPPRSPGVLKEFIKAYYATISHLDAQVGELIGQLRATGKLENTIVIFLSDNGYFLGNHGLGNKITMYEESVRVPFFVYGDQLKNKGTRFEGIVSSLDVLPTILDLAGITPPDYLHGKSLKEVLLADSPGVHDHVVSECIGVGGQLGEGHRMVRTSTWKYILSDSNEEALYNLEEDPYELNNLIEIEKHQPRIADLKQQLNDWKALTGDTKIYK